LSCPLRNFAALFPYTTLFRSVNPREDLRDRGDRPRPPHLSLQPPHQRLPVGRESRHPALQPLQRRGHPARVFFGLHEAQLPVVQDRKSTRLNSSHSQISYAVF